MQISFEKIMQIYKINFSLFTYFLTYLYFLWAWPKEACRMQTDRSTNKQTDDLCLLRQRIGEQGMFCLYY